MFESFGMIRKYYDRQYEVLHKLLPEICLVFQIVLALISINPTKLCQSYLTEKYNYTKKKKNVFIYNALYSCKKPKYNIPGMIQFQEA